MEAAAFRADRPAWTAEDERTAQILESLDWLRHQLTSGLIALGGGKSTPPKPKPIEHPDRPKPGGESPKKSSGKRRLATPADVVRTLSGG